MVQKKDYCVAGHVFSVVMDEGEGLWSEMGQYGPFALADGEAGDALFVLNVAGGDDFAGKGADPKSPIGTAREREIPLTGVADVSLRGLRDPRGADRALMSLCYRQDGEKGECTIGIYRDGEEGGWYMESASLASRPVSMKLHASADFSQAELFIAERSEALFALNNALMMLYAFRTAGMGTLEMHASVIMDGGKGYLFLAESGTGKSTHSRMWLENVPGSRLLNDDNPIVRVLDDGSVWVYGSPWSGKTPCYRNESCPVGAMVEIVRAGINRAAEKDAVNAFSRIWSSSSGMKFDEAMGEKLCDTVCGVVSAVKVFTLECLPDAEAARVCREAVTKG